jgi:methionyl-tRNA formyltransferase
MGTINLHGSLLPQYRGAAPISWAVINGEKETGVTTFKLRHEIDTGNILLQESLPIGEDETAGEVHDKMKDIGARLLVKTVKGLAEGTLKETPQSSIANSEGSMRAPQISETLSPFTIRDSPLKHAPKISTETGKIDFSKPVEEVHNLIRGMSPSPGAFTYLDGKTLKILKSEKEISAVKSSAGQFETDQKAFLKFACANGYIHVKELQLEGKKKMKVEDFLRGYRFN